MKAVQQPATKPANRAMAIAANGDIPAAIRTPQTQPPRGNAPSLVRSGKLSMRNGIMIPSTTKARIRLCARVTGTSETKLDRVF
ncbi:hypothetical protein D3C72_1711180 [compost metagenome]